MYIIYRENTDNSTCSDVNTHTHTCFLGSSVGKESAHNEETWVQSLGWEDPLEKGKATHSTILAWRIPWLHVVRGVAKSRTQWLSLSHTQLDKKRSEESHWETFNGRELTVPGLPKRLSGREAACQCRRCRRLGLDPRARKIPWRRKWLPTPVLLPGTAFLDTGILAGTSTPTAKFSGYLCTTLAAEHTGVCYLWCIQPHVPRPTLTWVSAR